MPNSQSFQLDLIIMSIDLININHFSKQMHCLITLLYCTSVMYNARALYVPAANFWSSSFSRFLFNPAMGSAFVSMLFHLPVMVFKQLCTQSSTPVATDNTIHCISLVIKGYDVNYEPNTNSIHMPLWKCPLQIRMIMGRTLGTSISPSCAKNWCTGNIRQQTMETTSRT